MGFERYVSEFDLENFELGSLLSETAIALDNHRLGRASDEEYQIINYVSELLLKKSREVRKGHYTHSFEDLFFWEFYGKEDINKNEFQKVNADRLAILSEDLKVVKDFQVEKIESLTNTILKLSKAATNCWVQQHPNGFKHYIS